jgi:hypothetical protein
MFQLGTFLFADFEIPENIKGMLSGKQMLAVKKLIGGQRVIDAMGPDPADIAWSGRFQGGDLVSRASLLSEMRDAGAPLDLVCDVVVLTVVIAEFNVSYERPYQGTYDIRLVVQPEASPDEDADTLDDAVDNDMTSANQIAAGGVTGAAPGSPIATALDNVSTGAAGL